VLVSNAGIVVVRSVEDTRVEELRRVLAVNVEGVFLGSARAKGSDPDAPRLGEFAYRPSARSEVSP
jgi:hypothetical protein